MPPRARVGGNTQRTIKFPSLCRAEESTTDDARSDSTSSSSGLDEDEGHDGSGGGGGGGGKQVVRGPSGDYYNISQLPREGQELVRAAYRSPPEMTPDYCRQVDERTIAFQYTERVPRVIEVKADGTVECRGCPERERGEQYQQQHQQQQQHHQQQQQQQQQQRLCSHILTFFDKLSKVTLYSDRRHGKTNPLHLTAGGYPSEMGCLPFEACSTFDLSLLADSLQCDVMGGDEFGTGTSTASAGAAAAAAGVGGGAGSGETPPAINPARWQAAREMLGAAQYTPQQHNNMAKAEFVNKFREDIFANDRPRAGKKRIKRGDLECTVTRMLVQNKDFFQYFLAQMRDSDPVKDRFRQLTQHIMSVLEKFVAYGRRCDREPAFKLRAAAAVDGTEPAVGAMGVNGVGAGAGFTRHDVPWAAWHMLHVVAAIRRLVVSKRRSPTSPTAPPLAGQDDLRSAAQALVRILVQVHNVNKRTHPAQDPRNENLCLRLVGCPPGEPTYASSSAPGGGRRLFVLDELSMLVDVLTQEQVTSLDSVYREITDVMHPEYRAGFDELLGSVGHLHVSSASSSATGSKRPAKEGGRGPKRKK